MALVFCVIFSIKKKYLRGDGGAAAFREGGIRGDQEWLQKLASAIARKSHKSAGDDSAACLGIIARLRGGSNILACVGIWLRLPAAVLPI